MSFRHICYIAIFVVSTCYADSVIGQTTVDTAGRKKNNIVEVFDRTYLFYDGSPLQVYYPLPMGFAYTRLISGSHALSLSYHKNGLYYWAEPYSRNPGDVMQRFVYMFNANYHYPLLYNHKIHFWLNSGVVYRQGYEWVHIQYVGIAEVKVESRDYRDWGGRIGCKVTRFLPWNFLISAEAGYTHFFYLKHKPGPFVRYPSLYDQGSPPNMSSVGVSFGYRF